MYCARVTNVFATQVKKVLDKVLNDDFLWPFQIVIEARNFVLDAFGYQGGVAAIDDIFYNASCIYDCRIGQFSTTLFVISALVSVWKEVPCIIHVVE